MLAKAAFAKDCSLSLLCFNYRPQSATFGNARLTERRPFLNLATSHGHQSAAGCSAAGLRSATADCGEIFVAASAITFLSMPRATPNILPSLAF